jgi:hypothetical protein
MGSLNLFLAETGLLGTEFYFRAARFYSLELYYGSKTRR